MDIVPELLDQEVRRVAPGEALIKAGEVGQAAYYILEGALKIILGIEGSSEKVYYAHPGEWVGEIALVLKSPRTAPELHPPDPYPFILLNLILSCLAAIQAPVIMMSQNRQEAKDRLRSQHDYQINLKAELEIRHLHDKLDHLLSHQWDRLVQIQEFQLDLLSAIFRDNSSNHTPI